jgi:hypothetical protein
MLYACKGAHTLFTSQREIKRERERVREREGEREREREREKEREMQNMVIEFFSLLLTMAGVKGMTGALAPFSCLIYECL